MKCTGKRCPMQHGVITPEHCSLFGQCEYQTPGPLSEQVFNSIGYEEKSGPNKMGDVVFFHENGNIIVINLNVGCSKWNGPEDLDMSKSEMVACAIYILENAGRDEK